LLKLLLTGARVAAATAAAVAAVQGTDNEQADCVQQAGIWSLSVSNNFIGNRFVLYFPITKLMCTASISHDLMHLSLNPQIIHVMHAGPV
jgi:hypothetical protein